MGNKLNERTAMSNNIKALIHGENGFKPVSKMPDGVRSKHKLFIAGHSETGHHHVVESDTEFDVVDFGGAIFIELFTRANVVHKKSFDIHETKTLEPGVYEVTHKTEYNPFTKVIERVFD